jgi:hypothetical protein
MIQNNKFQTNLYLFIEVIKKYKIVNNHFPVDPTYDMFVRLRFLVQF